MSKEIQKKAQTSSKKPQNLSESQFRRIREYTAQCLKRRNALRVNLGAEAGNLMSMGLQLQQGINKVLANSQDVLGELEKVGPAMEIYLKITRQWDRLVQFDQQLIAGGKRVKRVN